MSLAAIVQHTIHLCQSFEYSCKNTNDKNQKIILLQKQISAITSCSPAVNNLFPSCIHYVDALDKFCQNIIDQLKMHKQTPGKHFLSIAVTIHELTENKQKLHKIEELLVRKPATILELEDSIAVYQVLNLQFFNHSQVMEKIRHNLFTCVLDNLGFGLSSSDSEGCTPQILGFWGEVNGHRPFTSPKHTRDASKSPEYGGVKPETQVDSKHTSAPCLKLVIEFVQSRQYPSLITSLLESPYKPLLRLNYFISLAFLIDAAGKENPHWQSHAEHRVADIFAIIMKNLSLFPALDVNKYPNLFF